MTFSERLKFAMEMRGLTQAQLAESIGVSQPSIWKLVSGSSKGSKKIVEIAYALGVTPKWLLTGEEPMLAQRDVAVATKEGAALPEDTSSSLPAADVWSGSTVLSRDDVELPLHKNIELAASGAESRYMIRFPREALRRYGANPKAVFAFMMPEGSMSPVIPMHATVVVDSEHTTITDGGFYAIEQDGLFRLRMLYRMPGKRLSLRSYNKIDFVDEEAAVDSVRIVGRVISWTVMAW